MERHPPRLCACIFSIIARGLEWFCEPRRESLNPSSIVFLHVKGGLEAIVGRALGVERMKSLRVICPIGDLGISLELVEGTKAMSLPESSK